MKTKTMALAVLLLASAAGAALAQGSEPREPGERRGPRSAEVREARPAGGWNREARERPQAVERRQDFQRPERRQEPSVAPTPPQPAEARQAPSAGGWQGRGDGLREGARNWPSNRGDGGGSAGVRTGDDGRDDEDWDELRQARRWGGRQGEGWAFQGDRQRRDGDRRDGDRRDGDRRDGDRPGGMTRDQDRNDRGSGWSGNDRRDGSGWNRNDGRGGRDRDYDRRWRTDRRDSHGQPRWQQGRYRPVYQSQRRFRGPAWRPPIGFYVRSWSYGDFLPGGWYTAEYRIWDWWNYGLPMPPPGCSWVRVGSDVLLVDDFDGYVLQVVRMVFW